MASHDHQLGKVEWLCAVDNALAGLDQGWPTLFDHIDLTAENALAFEEGLVEPNHGAPDLLGWTSKDNTTFENALTELYHHGSSNQVELRDPVVVQINDFIEDVQTTEASPVILHSPSSSSTVPGRRPRIKWTLEEHRLFLEGFAKYGKGDWRSISRFSVVTRTPAQVACHALKYFFRLKRSQNNQGNSDTTTADAAAPSPP